jgi:hypothetical protein
LLGYLLHCLDPAESRQVEEHLEQSPQERRLLPRLRGELQHLDHWEEPQPPAELFYKTLRTVASQRPVSALTGGLAEAAQAPRRADEASPPAGQSAGVYPWAVSDPSPPLGSWRRADVWVSLAMLLLVCLAIPPALRFVRSRALQVECQDNLRNFYAAFLRYAENHQGSLPPVQHEGPLAHAGAFSVHLREAGLFGENMNLGCGKNKLVRPVSLSEAQEHDESDYDWWTRLGGSYGYHLGYIEKVNGVPTLRTIRIGDGSGIAIMSDRPPRVGEVQDILAANSPNHGGAGQNVLYLDGRVVYQITRRAVAGDDPDIFRNDQGKQRAGTHKLDTVLGPSEAQPLPPVID